MSDEAGTGPSQGADDGQNGGRRTRLDLVANELRRLHKMQATGELAALRRMDPDGIPPSALFHVLAQAGLSEMSSRDTIRRWTAAVHIMAQRPDALRPGDLGARLAALGVSTQRVDMLLSARGDTLRALARRTAMRLARSDEPLPYRELCRLVLDDEQDADRTASDMLRIAIAQSFQRTGRTAANRDGAGDHSE